MCVCVVCASLPPSLNALVQSVVVVVAVVAMVVVGARSHVAKDTIYLSDFTFRSTSPIE